MSARTVLHGLWNFLHLASALPALALASSALKPAPRLDAHQDEPRCHQKFMQWMVGPSNGAPDILPGKSGLIDTGQDGPFTRTLEIGKVSDGNAMQAVRSVS
jgi:hypothetical protein